MLLQVEKVGSMDSLCWCAKLNLALCCGEPVVSKRQMLAIPSPAQMTNFSRIHEANPNAGGFRGAPMHSAISPQLLAAMAAEK